jgi:hypothetical protein
LYLRYRGVRGRAEAEEGAAQQPVAPRRVGIPGCLVQVEKDVGDLLATKLLRVRWGTLPSHEREHRKSLEFAHDGRGLMDERRDGRVHIRGPELCLHAPGVRGLEAAPGWHLIGIFAGRLYLHATYDVEACNQLSELEPWMQELERSSDVPAPHPPISGAAAAAAASDAASEAALGIPALRHSRDFIRRRL